MHLMIIRILLFGGQTFKQSANLKRRPTNDAPKQRGQRARRLARERRREHKYSSHIYLWALLKSRQPEGPRRRWMRSFWSDTEWAIHKLLPCINTGRILKTPPSGSYSRVPKPTQTHERKQPAFTQKPPAFHIIPLCRALAHRRGKKKKGRTCPFSWKTLPIGNILETRGPSVSKERTHRNLTFRRWGIICAPPFPPRKLAAVLFSRRVEVNKGIFRVNPQCRGEETLEEFHLWFFQVSRWPTSTWHRGSGSDSRNGEWRNWNSLGDITLTVWWWLWEIFTFSASPWETLRKKGFALSPGVYF